MGEWGRRLTPEAFVQGGLVLAIALIVAFAILISDNHTRARRANDSVFVTHEINTALEGLLSSITAAEAAVRGYVITSDESFLARSGDLVERLRQLVARIDALVVDPEQKKRMDELRPVLEQRIALLDQTVAARRRSFEEAESLVLSGAPLRLSSEITARIESLKEKESELLEQRRERAEALVRAGDTLLVVASVLSLAMVAAVFALAMRAIRDARARAQHEAAHAAHLEERVQSRTAELELANRELESFSYSVSHDLRAPLRAMTGFSRELEEDFGPSLGPEGKLLTSRIHDNARRMSQIIDDLLLLSKTTRGEVNRQRVNLSHLFSEAFAQALARHPRSASEVIVQPDVEVEADPRMIEPLVENLARNAWKFSRDSNPSRVEFGETVIEGERTFFVRDNGVGFDAELFERALQPFERLVSNREFEGTGVGLAICDRVVRRHDGRMWADSAPGKGATIYFTLSAEPR